MKTKKLFYAVFAMLFAVSSFSISCKSDDDGGSGGSAAEGTITYKVDGQKVTTMSMTSVATFGGAGSNQILAIQGSDSGTSPNRAVRFNLAYDGPGTYSFSDGVINQAMYIELTVDPNNPMGAEEHSWMAMAGIGSGEIKISEQSDTHVKGTFHFVGHSDAESPQNREITEGSFNVKIQ